MLSLAANMIDAKTIRLAERAAELHKALSLGVAILGRGAGTVGNSPDFRQMMVKPLKRTIDELEENLGKLSRILVLDPWTTLQRKTATSWLADKYDQWLEARQSIFEIGRVHEVEAAIGPLMHRKQVECPPYAQVLLQGYFGAAIRHPEYHLARDLALLNNLFLDAEEIADDHLRNKRSHSNETSQSLARSVILTCYNLLESFISGLVAAYTLEHPNAPEEMIKKLQKPKDRSLKARFEEVPALVSGVPGVMEPFKSVLTQLFGDYQKRRNAFVHCEPGPATAKETFFHETDAKTVRETISLTMRAIRSAWSVVHKTEGPRWLPDPDAKGRFPNVDVNIKEGKK